MKFVDSPETQKCKYLKSETFLIQIKKLTYDILRDVIWQKLVI